MNRKEQARYRPLLENMAAEIGQRLAAEEGSQPVAPDRAIGRLTRVDAMQAQQLALAIRRRHQQRLQRIQHALELIGRGEYGVCTRCGQDIDVARLEVAPDTFLCMPCTEALQPR